MDCGPQSRAHQWVRDAEISVVLMPISACSVMCRLEEDLVEMEHDWATDELRDGLSDFGGRMAERGTMWNGAT